MFSLTFKNPRQGVAVGGDFLAPDNGVDASGFTHDGGRTWTTLSEDGFDSVECTPDGLGLRLGRTGGSAAPLSDTRRRGLCVCSSAIPATWPLMVVGEDPIRC